MPIILYCSCSWRDKQNILSPFLLNTCQASQNLTIPFNHQGGQDFPWDLDYSCNQVCHCCPSEYKPQVLSRVWCPSVCHLGENWTSQSHCGPIPQCPCHLPLAAPGMFKGAAWAGLVWRGSHVSSHGSSLKSFSFSFLCSNDGGCRGRCSGEHHHSAHQAELSYATQHAAFLF